VKLCMYCQCPSNCVFLFIVLVICCSQLLLIVLFVELLLISPSLVVCLSGVVAVELELDVAGLVGELHGDVDCIAPWCDMASVQPLLCRSTRLQHNKSGHKQVSQKHTQDVFCYWRRCDFRSGCCAILLKLVSVKCCIVYVDPYICARMLVMLNPFER
jgi:hypothetical protein